MAGPNSRDILDHKSEKIMDQQTVRGQHTPTDQQIHVDQKVTFDQQKITPEERTLSDKHIAVAQQTAIEQEPKSDQDFFPNQLITPEGNEAYLRQHQRNLRFSYPSCDLSEVSYHTEQTGFPGSRHSSINTEPLTLDAEQIHDAKDQAVDATQQIDTKTAFDNFTKDTLNTIIGRVSMMEYYWRQGQDLEYKSNEALSPESGVQVFTDQMNTLVEKAHQVVEANEQQQAQLMDKIPGASSASLVAETKGEENSVTSVEDDVKLKND